MNIAFTKMSDERHELAIVRADGSRESVELETRSFLLHDLVHYAVEAEAQIEDGFWGLLARGVTFATLNDRGSGRTMASPSSPGLAVAETLVGPMQSVYKGRLAEAAYVELARAASVGVPADHVLRKVDAAFVESVLARLRALTGHWRATRFREAMVLEWR